MYMYHECGQPLWVESIKEYDHCLTQFYDAREKRPQAPILMCPNCRQALAHSQYPESSRAAQAELSRNTCDNLL
jgi:hypothetical protein